MRAVCYKPSKEDRSNNKTDPEPQKVVNPMSDKEDRGASSPEGPSSTVRPAHSSGGPTAGLVDKIKDLDQRRKDTPGDNELER